MQPPMPATPERRKMPLRPGSPTSPSRRKNAEDKTCLFGLPLFDPRTSSFLVVWDCITLFALVYTALVTPFEVSFVTDFSAILFAFNRIIDVVFIVDMYVSFSTTIAPTRAMQLNGVTQWQTKPDAIAYNYVTGWFTIDFVSVAVSAGDIASLFLTDDAGAGVLMMIQLLRVVRLLKMVRLLRGLRMWKRWETRHAVNYKYLKLLSCLVTILVNSHWIACVWSLQTLFKPQRHESWLGRGNIPYCVAPDEEAAADGPSVCLGPWDVWTASMHFSVMTITSIGYGDIFPTDNSEQIVGLALMLVSGIQWASTIGTLCAVLTESPEMAQFHEDIDNLNKYMDDTNVAGGLRQRLREFFHEAIALRRNKSTQALLTQMPPSLLAELVLQTNGHWLNAIPLLTAPGGCTDLSDLKGLDPETSSHRYFLVEVMLSLVSVVYSPQEVVSDGYISVITNGLAFIGMNIGGTGSSFGEDSLLAAKHLRKRQAVVAIKYLSVFMIEPAAIYAVAQKYPLFGKVLRKRVVSLAFKRMMSNLAAEARAVRDEEDGSKIIKVLRRLQANTVPSVTPPNHAYRAQQMLDPVIYDTVCNLATEQSAMRKDIQAILQHLGATAAATGAEGVPSRPLPPPAAAAPAMAGFLKLGKMEA